MAAPNQAEASWQGYRHLRRQAQSRLGRGRVAVSADPAELRAALTRALQPHLPPARLAFDAERLARLAEAAIGRHGFAQAEVASLLVAALPEPYRSLAAIAEAIAPVVADYWQRRLVEIEAGSVVIREHRP